MVSRKSNVLVVFERDAFGILCIRCNKIVPTDPKQRQERFGEDERSEHYVLKPDERWKIKGLRQLGGIKG